MGNGADPHTRRVAAAAALLGLLLAGCTTTVTSRLATDAVHEGILYHLPRELVRLEVTSGTPTLTKLEVHPDPDHAYVAQFERGVFSSDEVTIETNEQGFLEKVDVTSDGRLGQIILKLSEAAKEAAKAYAAFQTFPAGDPGFVAKDARQVRIDFDPSSAAEIARVNDALDRAGTGIRLSVTPAEYAMAAPAVPVHGIVHRRPVGYDFTLQGAGVTQSHFMLVHAGGPIAVLPVDGALFVRNTSVMTFSEGDLTKVTVAQPNELEGFVSILPQMFVNIAAIPSEIVARYTQRLGEDKDLLAARQAYVDSQRQLVEAQKQLAAARAGKPPAKPGETGDGAGSGGTRFEDIP